MARDFLDAVNLKSGLTLAGSAGNANQVLISQGSSNPIWANLSGSISSSYIAIGILNADQTILNTGTDTVISFIDYADPNNWWDPTTKRFQPNIAGYYNISVQGWWVYGVVTTQTNIQIRKNGNSVAIYQGLIENDTDSGKSLGGSRIVYLNGSTDYVDFSAYTANTTSQVLQKGTVDGSGTYFSAHLISNSAGYQYLQTITVGSGGTNASPFTLTKSSYPGLRAIRIRAVGGGGSGGGSTGGSGSASNGGGGGGGEYREAIITDLSSFTSLTITAGAGGPAASASANGNAGSPSTVVTNGSVTLLSATGGSGGISMNAITANGFSPGASGGTGGSVTSPATLIQAMPGGDGGSGRVIGGVATVNGIGGSSMFAGTKVQPGTASSAGNLYGGGGTGGLSAGTSAAGGAGASGIVILDLYA
jgi:hypothetical protein